MYTIDNIVYIYMYIKIYIYVYNDSDSGNSIEFMIAIGNISWDGENLGISPGQMRISHDALSCEYSQ